MLRKVLLVCGIVASLLYVAATIVGAMVWHGYSTVDQEVSELFAVDAPSRSIVIASFLAYDVLMIAFAVGVWRSAGQKQGVRAIAVLIAFDQLRGAAGTLFAPMHPRGVPGSSTDVWHIILTSATVLLIMLILGFGAFAFGPRFRLYSIATLLVLVVFGALAGLQGPQMAANLPTPWMGVEERINIFGYMLWVVVMAIGLLRVQREQPQEGLSGERAVTSGVGSGRGRSSIATVSK